MSEIRHAGLIARRCQGRWLGVLIEGPSGAGKSDLALRALASGFRLVSDDRTVVFVSAGQLFGKAPAVLAGLIEVRALDVIACPGVPFAQIGLVVRCVADGEAPPRLAEMASTSLLGVAIPCLALAAREASASLKLAAALEHLGGRRQPLYQAPGQRAGPSRPPAMQGL